MMLMTTIRANRTRRILRTRIRARAIATPLGRPGSRPGAFPVTALGHHLAQDLRHPGPRAMRARGIVYHAFDEVVSLVVCGAVWCCATLFRGSCVTC